MASYDSSDFVDTDLESARKSPYASATASSDYNRPPSREEIDSKVSDAQAKLLELKRAQEELERERAALEETRRRQIEFTTGREEMLQALTRGVGLLEESEFAARRDAEQMARTMGELRHALDKVKAISEEGWTKDNFSMEVTRALTTIENARLEWNSARLKFPVLSGTVAAEGSATAKSDIASVLATGDFRQLCKLGLALTWPVVAVGVAIMVLLICLLMR